MNGKPQHRPFFWPVLFLTAFVTAALLWAIWMYVLVQKTRSHQQNGFFVPQGNPPAVSPANPSSQPTNSAGGTNK